MLAACAAEPPTALAGQHPDIGTDRYATFGRCSPRDGQQPTCPGPSCGENATGAPDGNVVDLASCGTLDLAFTSGVVISLVGKADLGFHVQGEVDGQTRIEASADGVDYVLVGFIAEAPPGTPADCVARKVGDEVLVDFDPCNLISNVSFIRLANELGTSGSVKIDAVEALSFEAH